MFWIELLLYEYINIDIPKNINLGHDDDDDDYHRFKKKKILEYNFYLDCIISILTKLTLLFKSK